MFLSLFRINLKNVCFSLPQAIGILQQLKLPTKLIALIDNSTGIYQKSTVSASTSSSSISLEATTSTNYSPPLNENDMQTPGEMSLLEWITAQVIHLFYFDIYRFVLFCLVS